MSRAAKLRGEVTRLTLRRLKDGRIRHDTRIQFEPGTPFRYVRITGTLPGIGWGERLLAALQSRYDVRSLPEPHWFSTGSVSQDGASELASKPPAAGGGGQT